MIMAPTTEVTITIPTLEGIAAVLAVVYCATVVAHPYIAGILLMSWSYQPERPFEIIRYAAWTLPKKWIATVRGWLPSKAASEAYKPLSGYTTPIPNYYGSYMPTGAGGCQLGCCNPTPYSYTASPYLSPSPPPIYGAIPSSPYPNHTSTGCQLGCCKTAPYYHSPYSSSSFPNYGAVPSFTPRAYEREYEDEDGESTGWQAFGWGLWFGGLAVMVVYGPGTTAL